MNWLNMGLEDRFSTMMNLRSEKLTATATAIRLGCSRGAVAGFWSRYPECKPDTENVRRGNAQPKGLKHRSVALASAVAGAKPTKELNLNSGHRNRNRKSRGERAALIDSWAQVTEVADPVPYISAKANQCAFPLWASGTPLEQKMVCGAAVDPDARKPFSRYCCHHAQVARSNETRSMRRRDRRKMLAAVS